MVSRWRQSIARSCGIRGKKNLPRRVRHHRVRAVPLSRAFRFAREGTGDLPPLSAFFADGGGRGGGQAFQAVTEPRLCGCAWPPPYPPPLGAGEGAKDP